MTRSAAVGRFAEPRMYVGGQWRAASDGSTLTSVDPTTEEVVAQIADATSSDVDDAVAAAEEASSAWRALSPQARAAKLNVLADRIAQHEDELAEIDAVESGNPRSAMLDDVRGAVRDIRMFSGFASQIKGASVADGADRFSYEMREPYGVVGRIIPFNHPLKFAASKAASALIAGNTLVLKPSEETSLSALRLAELSKEILAPGVLNVVTGRGERAGAAIAGHPDVPRVSFTGGVPAGRAVLRAGAEYIKHVTLELGGKNPMIVFPDADPVAAARAAVTGMNFARTQGQSCQSNSRVFVHADIREQFTAEVLDRVAEIRMGDPLVDGTDFGPLAFRSHYERVLGYIRTGIDEGAGLLAGGGTVEGPGFFVPPTVFGDVEPTMAIARDEIFGPVLSLITWTDEEQVIAAANDTPFGLTANIWTRDLRSAHRTAHRIEAGYVWVNGSGKRVPGTPFGGYKLSGLGKESSLEEVLEFTRHKVIAVDLQR